MFHNPGGDWHPGWGVDLSYFLQMFSAHLWGASLSSPSSCSLGLRKIVSWTTIQTDQPEPPGNHPVGFKQLRLHPLYQMPMAPPKKKSCLFWKDLSFQWLFQCQLGWTMLPIPPLRGNQKQQPTSTCMWLRRWTIASSSMPSLENLKKKTRKKPWVFLLGWAL